MLRRCKKRHVKVQPVPTHVAAGAEFTIPWGACWGEHVHACARLVASAEKSMALTYELWPRNSLRDLPDLIPCTRTNESNEPDATCRRYIETNTDFPSHPREPGCVSGKSSKKRDGVVPLNSAHLADANAALTLRCYHSINEAGTTLPTDRWYGSEAVVDRWLGPALEKMGFAEET